MFINFRTGEPTKNSSYDTQMYKLCEKAGIRNISMHGLRHTYCSVLLTQSVPIQTVTKYLGHSESTVTLEVYSHFMPDTQERALNALDVITGKK